MEASLISARRVSDGMSDAALVRKTLSENFRHLHPWLCALIPHAYTNL